jgi:hypothetical protein
MGYRIRVVPEVEAWLEQLREIDPRAADLVDEALDTLREAGAGLGPPLVAPVEIPAQETRPDLDLSYQRQLEMLTRARRGVAVVAATRKRLELQIEQLEKQAARLSDQLGQALAEAGEPNPHVIVQEDGVIEPPTVQPRRLASPPLSELRPGAPESTDIRILFTVGRAEDHPDTALLLAAGTERDWLRAWYTEMLLHCRTRYERDQGTTG